ncbi:MAG: molybdopterin-dependent oxidoreductase [Clostridiaceae bacterium]|nr:molybdopterin-dependent oxidoreductase [Clostridiaceae bacterium]
MKLHVVGQNNMRVDAAAKVTGKALYPEDVSLEGMFIGKTLRSHKPHACITIDTSRAEAMEGVVKVLTYKDVPHNHYGVLMKDHEVFCSEKVRRIGDPIAFVVAVDEEVASKALAKIKVEYRELKAVFDPEVAMHQDAPKLHGESNIVYHYKLRQGDIEKGLEESAVVVENTYVTPMVDHVFLQPEAGVAHMEKDTIVVTTATQYPHFDQLEIAEALEVEKEKVKVINAAVGGAFGGREDITLQIHLALATKLTGKPVKAVYSREESFIAHAKRHAMVMTYKTGADEEGKLKAMEARIIGDTGAYASWAINIMRKAGVHATGPYEIPNVKVDSYAVYTNNPFGGAMRGFGATQPPIAHEQQMDMLAEALNIDPISIRLTNAFKIGSKTATGQILKDSVPLRQCIEAVAEKLGFSVVSRGV